LIGNYSVAQSEKITAESFMTSIVNDVLSLAELCFSSQADKKMLQTKFNTLVANIESAGINPGSIKYSHYNSEKLYGLNTHVMVIIYELNGKYWDDLFVLIDSETYDIKDIGSPEKTFKQNETVAGKNNNDLSMLAKYFYPNLPVKTEVIQAAKKLIGLSKADNLEEFIPLVAYKGQDDPNRKNLSVPLNPKLPQDRTKASSIMSEIRATFEGPETAELEGAFQIYPDDASCYLRLRCNGNKNSGDFRFVLRNGKYLLSYFD
jgi:hypothetical protein